MNWTCFAFLLLTSLFSARVVGAQRPACGAPGYEHQRAVRSFHSYLVKGNRFAYFKIGPYRQEVFATKAALRKTSQLEIIPVLAVTHPERLADTASAAELETLFSPTYCQFAAFLLRDRLPAALMFSSPRQREEQTRPSSFSVDSTGALHQVADTFYAPGVCLFYDATLRTFAYLDKGAYVYWDGEVNRFAKVQGVAGYRQLYRRVVTH